MKKISIKNQNTFISEMKKGLLEIGAVPFISDEMQFDLKTKFGIFWIRVDEDNSIVYSVFGRFVDTKKIPDLPNVNSYSGKYNHHYGPEANPKILADVIVNNFRKLLN